MFRLLPLLFVLLLANSLKGESAARVWNEELLSAIRLNVPNPPAHARNLFHSAVVMYDCWAAYDAVAVGYLHHEKITPLPGNVEAARAEAIHYAAYRLLRSRFMTGTGSSAIQTALNARLVSFGGSLTVAQAAVTNGLAPAELGKRIADAVLLWSATDGFNAVGFPQAYTSGLNPNLDAPMTVLGRNVSGQSNMPMGSGIPATTQPNFWQPLSFSLNVTQNGIPTPGGVQGFIGVQSLATTPFALTRADSSKPWLDPFGGPCRLSLAGQPSTTDLLYKQGALEVIRASSQLNDSTLVDISPAGFGNHPLGADTGTGYAVNPITSSPYTPALVKRGDFARVLAEYWADGPHSETPPGHWHVIANEVAESPQLEKRLRGVGVVLNELEWDVKTYFALGAAVHDAACAAWALKRYYSGVRPITMIRYMGIKGQSSNPSGPSYHSEGLPLEPGLVEVITAASTNPGQRHFLIWDVSLPGYDLGATHVGKIAIRSWPGEHPSNPAAPGIATHQSAVCWMLARDWLPFQRKAFNTPAFPGYVSGHSTFSRAAAEVLSRLTGSTYFPGGFHHHTVAVNTLQMDLGPSTAVDLQWARYADAADQAGQSRRWGGIHISEDDYHGRVIGAQVGALAFDLAEKYWSGAIAEERITATLTRQPDGSTQLSWPSIRGHWHEVQASENLVNWQVISPAARAYEVTSSWTDLSAPTAGQRFYRVIRRP